MYFLGYLSLKEAEPGLFRITEVTMFQNINIIYYRTLAELKAEASNSFAGYIWWVLQPLLALAVYYTAFHWLIPNPDQNFVLFLFIGITVWQFWANTLLRSSSSMIVYRPLMLQLDIEKYVFPVSICCVNFIKFTVAFVLLLVLTPVLGGILGCSAIHLLELLILLFLLTCGTGMILAAIAPFFPDLIMVIDFLLHLMMFLSGVFFDLTLLPKEIQKLLFWNPIAGLMTQFRKVLMDGSVPEWNMISYIFLLSILLLFGGGGLLKLFSRKYPRLT